MCKICLLLLCCCLFAINAFPQTYVTLEDCINAAYENNLNVAQSKLSVLSLKEDVKQTRAAMFPSLNGSSSLNHIGGRVVDPNTNQYSTKEVWTNNHQLNGSVVLFNGLQLRNTYKQKRYDFLSGESDVNKQKDELALAVTYVFFQILLNQELLKSYKDQLSATNSLYQKTEKQVEKGVLLKGALLDLAARQASEESSILIAENTLQMLYIDLINLMGLKPEDRIEVVAPDVKVIPDLPEEDPETIYKKSLEFIPEVRSAEYKILSAERMVAINVGKRSPLITLNASAGTIYASSVKKYTGMAFEGVNLVGLSQRNDSVFSPKFSPVYVRKPFREQMTDNLSKGIGVSMYIPIVNNMKVRTSISKAQIDLKVAENDLQLQKNELRKTVYKSYYDLVGSRKTYFSLGKTLVAEEEAYKNAEVRFEHGVITSYDYYQVKNRYAQAESKFLESKYDYLFKLKVLNYYRGLPFTF